MHRKYNTTKNMKHISIESLGDLTFRLDKSHFFNIIVFCKIIITQILK
jgi:hypothetical protein